MSNIIALVKSVKDKNEYCAVEFIHAKLSLFDLMSRYRFQLLQVKARF